jgi:DNA-binding response OmpR family regulator
MHAVSPRRLDLVPLIDHWWNASRPPCRSECDLTMNLKALLVSVDDRTVRVLRRVLGDLEIDVEHCVTADNALRRITRQRYEAIIVDGANSEEAGRVLLGAKSAPVNKRALSIVMVEADVGLKGGFALGAHFVLHKPFAVERAKASFRAVRALMKRERRMQMRLAVEIPVECYGSSRYKAKTSDLCEGGMAIQFIGRKAKESALRFSLDLPGSDRTLEIQGELAWEGTGEVAGVRFKDPTDEQRKMLRQWLTKQLPEPDEDDPPVNCGLSDLSVGGCYLTTNSPFPRGTRVVLSIKANDMDVRATGIVLVAHPEFGMGVEFLRSTAEQTDQAERMIATLQANEGKHPEVSVLPDGLETALAGRSKSEDPLVDLFRQNFQVPVEAFLQQMREQRQALDSR